ncbi:MAG: hypothetical protein R6X19_07410 [Kiritimatiellia bacterium]
MKKLICALFTVAYISAVASAQDVAAPNGGAGEKWLAKATAGEAVYVCDKCHMMADKEGKCAMCSGETKAMHLIKVKDDIAYVCTCPAKCICATTKLDDPTKCACGMDVKEFSTKDGKASMKIGAKIKEAGKDATDAVKDLVQ